MDVQDLYGDEPIPDARDLGLPHTATVTLPRNACNNDRRAVRLQMAQALHQRTRLGLVLGLFSYRSYPLSGFRTTGTSFVNHLATAIVVIPPLEPEGILKVSHFRAAVLAGTNFHQLPNTHSYLKFQR